MAPNPGITLGQMGARIHEGSQVLSILCLFVSASGFADSPSLDSCNLEAI